MRKMFTVMYLTICRWGSDVTPAKSSAGRGEERETRLITGSTETTASLCSTAALGRGPLKAEGLSRKTSTCGRPRPGSAVLHLVPCKAPAREASRIRFNPFEAQSKRSSKGTKCAQKSEKSLGRAPFFEKMVRYVARDPSGRSWRGWSRVSFQTSGSPTSSTARARPFIRRGRPARLCRSLPSMK